MPGALTWTQRNIFTTWRYQRWQHRLFNIGEQVVVGWLRAAFLPSLQIKSQDIFDAWVSKLRHHRLYRQNEIVRSPREATMRTFPPPAAVESPQPTSIVVREAKVSPPHPISTCWHVIVISNTQRCWSTIVYKVNIFEKIEASALIKYNNFWWLSCSQQQCSQWRRRLVTGLYAASSLVLSCPCYYVQ